MFRPTPRALRIAYFGLPLGALLLAADGHFLRPCVLSPVGAPGGRRLRRAVAGEVLDARELGDSLPARVAERLGTPDLLVSWFWTRKLPVEWLNAPSLAAIGAHPSLLPRHRGPNPYFWTIDGGDAETGVSVHLLDAEYDRGAVLDVERIAVGPRNAWQLARALDRPSLRALRRTVAAFACGEPPVPRPQDESLATPAPEPSGDALRVDFHWPTERVLRRIRALAPVPGLALSLRDRDFFVLDAAPTPRYASALIPGEAQIEANRLVLRTGDGAILVERAVLAGPEEDPEPETLTGDALAKIFGELIDSGPLEVC
jgi:methionyl-tRNA formyltransferase